MSNDLPPGAEEGYRFRRILMALDPSSEDLSTVEATAALARGLRAELLSLFVEDIDLIRLAQHPEFSAFSTLSAGPQPFAADNLRRALRRQLTRSRHAVEQAAAHQRIKSVFQVRQGRPVAEIVSASGTVDLVVIGWGRRDTPATLAFSRAATVRAIVEAASRPVLLLRPGAAGGGPVMVAYGGTEVDRRALKAAAEIAQHDGGIVEIAMPATPADRADQWRRDISAALANTHLTVRFLAMPRGTLEDLCAAATHRGVSLLVLGGDSNVLTGGAALRAFERAGCSLLLVR